MDEQARPCTHAEGITLMDPEVNENPFDVYRRLRDEHPVYRDPVTGFFIVTRFEDARRVYMDPETFRTKGFIEKAKSGVDAERQTRMTTLYREKGWLPGVSLTQHEGEEHREKRNLFMKALRVTKVGTLEPFIRETANTLIDAFEDKGECEFVASFASLLPLTVITKQLGAHQKDVVQIKRWIDSWTNRLGMMQTEEEERASVEDEIDAQHFFKPIMDGLRSNPDDSVLSELLNYEFRDGRKMSDEEFFGHFMADLFVGGSETTMNAFGNGMMLLCQNPEIEPTIRLDPSKQVRNFIEESLRLEAPTQMLFRVAANDVEISRVHIPKGAVIGVNFGAANRDDRRFVFPDEIKLDREQISAHVAFGGGGPHHCIGAPLARLELQIGWEELLRRLERFEAPRDRNDLSHHPNMILRGLKKLNISFSPR